MSDTPAYGADERKDDPEVSPDDVQDEIEVDEMDPIEGDEDPDDVAADEPVVDFGESRYGEPEMEMVPCAYCGEPHPPGAWRCRACSGFLPIIEETIHKEHFFFLFCSLALFLGTFLVWEPMTWITGATSILGGFLVITSAYAVFASIINIFHRRMIVWPHLLSMGLGLWAGWQRVIQLLNGAKLPAKGEDFAAFKKYVDAIFHVFGPGLYVVVPVSTIMLVFLIVSIFVAGKRDAQRKAAMRSERGADRGARRRR